MDKTDHANKGQIRNIKESIYILIYKHEVLGIIKSPVSLDMTCTTYKMMCPTILLMLHVYPLPLECVCPATSSTFDIVQMISVWMLSGSSSSSLQCHVAKEHVMGIWRIN